MGWGTWMAGGNPIPTAPGAMEGTVGPGSQAVSPSSPLPHRHPRMPDFFFHPSSSSDHLSTLTCQRPTHQTRLSVDDSALRPRSCGRVSSSTLGTNEGRGSMDQCTQPCWASGEARNRAGTAGRGGGEREEAGVLVNVHHPPRHDSTRTKSRPEYQRCILQTTTRWMHAVASPVCGILQYAPLLRRYMSAVRPCIG